MDIEEIKTMSSQFDIVDIPKLNWKIKIEGKIIELIRHM